MTISADGFARRDSAGSVRWGGSLAIVLALHAGIALLLITHRLQTEPPGSPPAAVMIDLEPLPAPPAPAPMPTPQPEPTPPPPQVLEPQPAPPPEPVVPDIPPPPPIPVPVPQPAVTLPAKPPPPPRKPSPKHEAVIRRPPPLPLPVQPLPSPQAPVAAMPAPRAAAPPAPMMPSAASIAGARANWQSKLVGWLARYKRYPRLAQEQHQQGTALLRFSMDRQGRVISAQLARGSGFSLLDDEAMALIQRAQPLPAPPPELAGERFELVIPIEFSLLRN